MKSQLSICVLLVLLATGCASGGDSSLLDSFKRAFNFDWVNACGGGLQTASKGCAEAQGAAFDPFSVRSTYDQESCCQLHHFFHCTRDRVGGECSDSFAGKKFFETLEKTMGEQCGRYVCSGAGQLSQVSALLFGSLLMMVATVFGYHFFF